MNQPQHLAPSGASSEAESQTGIDADLLVEEVSIDGMCGVY